MNAAQLEEVYARRKAASRFAATAACDDPEVKTLTYLGLTPRQAQLFLFVFRRSLATGSQPSIREIGEAFGITSPNGVIVNIKAIQKKGWWDQSPISSSRSLRFLRQPSGEPFRGFVCH